jgi:hypothetical protein
VGGRRLEHLAYIGNDAFMQRFCPLQLLHTSRTSH